MTVYVVLVDYGRPIFEDRLMPFGHLRDLPSQIRRADVVIVSKCPAELDELERAGWRERLNLREDQPLLFTTISYCQPEPVFPEADSHYLFSHRLVLVSGIANNASLRMYLSDTYKIVQKLEFPDHHRFSTGDVRSIASASKANPTACLMTTEKDAQRLRDCKNVPQQIRERLFFLPIQATFLTEEEDRAFTELLLSPTWTPASARPISSSSPSPSVPPSSWFPPSWTRSRTRSSSTCAPPRSRSAARRSTIPAAGSS